MEALKFYKVISDDRDLIKDYCYTSIELEALGWSVKALLIDEIIVQCTIAEFERAYLVMEAQVMIESSCIKN